MRTSSTVSFSHEVGENNILKRVALGTEWMNSLLVIVFLSCSKSLFVKPIAFECPIVCLYAVFMESRTRRFHWVCHEGVFIFNDQQMHCTIVNWNENSKSRNNVKDKTETPYLCSRR